LVLIGAMATQTKVEPVDDAVAKASTNTADASARVIDAEQRDNDASPVSGSALSSMGQHNPIDDEDVSLDELMMSDSNEDDDEPERATDVLGAATSPVAEVVAAERSSEDEASANMPGDPFGATPMEEDEAAALAAAAAAQEAAAQAAEADARRAAAQRAAEATPSRVGESQPRPRSRSASSPTSEANPPSVAPSRIDAPEPAPISGHSADDDLEPPTSSDEEPPMSVELEPSSVQLDVPVGAAPVEPASAASPSASSQAIAASASGAAGAPRRDAPLPSFDIPDIESASARRRDEEQSGNRSDPPPLSHLSEAADEDDDDAVTHIGLPVVPDYADLQAGFQVADPGVAPLTSFEPDVSLTDSRRATTRVLPRLDPAQLAQRRAASDTNPALTSSSIRRETGSGSSWFGGLFKRSAPERSDPALMPPVPPRRSGWLLDTVLPHLSLVLFGSGIGAGIMLLQPDGGAKATHQAQAIQSLAPATKPPVTLAERAEAGEGDALFKITNMSPNDRNSALTLALERGYQAQKQSEFKEFVKLLETPGGLNTPNLTARFLTFATSPETMLAAFAHLLDWPGSTGPDVLYAVWEKAPGGNRAASLAQQLLHSADQRSKATPALLTALDLRSATSCEDYLRVLPAVQRDGDQRCSATLRALKHEDGCGDDGQQDCFACLRDSPLLDTALTAIEGRVAPQL
jgi:hypothetical protein